MAESEDSEILNRATKRLSLCIEADGDNRDAYLDDIKFVAGDQWPAGIKSERERERRPCLTVNRMPQFLRQITNEQRQNTPSIKVHPVDSGADPDTAEILAGLIRHIEYDSNADTAYQTAGYCAAAGGVGYFRILTEYADAETFDQDIKISAVRNPLSVYMDPMAVEPDGSDAGFCFITETMTRKEFESQYPDATPVDFRTIPQGDERLLWFGEDMVTVAEYFEVVTERVSLKKGDRERIAERKKIAWYKLNGQEILERSIWPSRRYHKIPVIKVSGEIIDINGKEVRVSAIRHAKDPQRMLNYWRSASTELVALTPKAPFIGASGQFEGHEKEWKQANTANLPYLEYEPTSVNGQLVPPPQRQQLSGIPAGHINEAASAAEDMKACTGIYDASLGARGNETSGKAILARQREGDVGTFHFTDNLVKSIRHAARILVDIIPAVFDTPRMVRVLGEDSAPKLVEVNNGLRDLGAGKYDVVVVPGPSFTTKRIESAQSMMDFLQYVPDSAPIIADLIAKNMDWPGSEAIAKRLKAMLPPQLQGIEDSDENGGIAAALSAQKAALEQQFAAQIEQVQAEFAKKEQELAGMEQGVQAGMQKLAEQKRDLEVRALKQAYEEDVLKLQEKFAAHMSSMQAEKEASMQESGEMLQIIPAIAQMMQQMGQMVGQMQQTMENMTMCMGALAQKSSAPRQIMVKRDGAGNIVGAAADYGDETRDFSVMRDASGGVMGMA